MPTMRFLPGLRSLADAVHANGAKIGIQLSPGGGAQAAGPAWFPVLNGTVEAVSPSGIPALHSDRESRVLTTGEVEGIIEACGESALRVKNAGYDLVNIHGHGGYLIAQFLSPYFNRRSDRYGGSTENRFRFLLDMLSAMRARVGPGFPITVKYSIDEYIDGGRGLEESCQLAKRLEEQGSDAIFIAVGAHGSRVPIVPPHFIPVGSHLPLAVAIKKTVSTPVIVGARLNAPTVAENALREGKADFIALGRALIADPDWPQKVSTGTSDEIRPCLACNVCRQHLFTSEPIRCAINAVAGREGQQGANKPAEKKKKVLVVGGGPAGLETAQIAALRGHRVILCEKTNRLGGLLQLAGVFNKEIEPFLNWLETSMRTLSVEVRLNTTVTEALIKSEKPDALIFAGGARFLWPSIPGADRKNVFGGDDLLRMVKGQSLPGKGALLSLLAPLSRYFYRPGLVRLLLTTNLIIKQRVVIIGGQLSGCKLAFHLTRVGKKVTVIENSDSYGAEMEETTLDTLNYEIQDGNVRMLTGMRVQEITEQGVVIVDRQGKRSVEAADTVIIALGLETRTAPNAHELDGTAKELIVIGDANGFRGIKDAISDGYVSGFHL